MSEKNRESSSSSSDSDSDSSSSSSGSSGSSSSSSSSSSSASSTKSLKKLKSSVSKDAAISSNGAKNVAAAVEGSSTQEYHSKSPESSVQIVEKSVADSSESPNQTKKYPEKDSSSPKPSEIKDLSPKEKNESIVTTEKVSLTPETTQEKEDGEIENEKSTTAKETNEKRMERSDHRIKASASRRSRDRRRRRSRSNRSRSRSLERRRYHRSSRNRSRDRSRHRRNHSRDRSKHRRNRSRDDKHRRTKRSKTKSPEKKDPEAIPKKQQKTVDILTSKTGGAYIPPAKLRALQAEITDKSSAPYQRIAWEALKKSIHGFINKVNVDNIGIITRQLLKENIVRGRGLLCRSIIQAQAASPTFTHVYAALVSVINSKFPNIGELLLQRLVIQFKRGFRRNDKPICISATRFIAHLINQRVAHEILALEILTLLVEMPTDDSVEVAIAFLKECGMKLQEVSAKGVNAIFEMLKNILHEGKLEKRVQYMIEVVFQVRKDGFKDHVSVTEALELVEEDDQFTHLIMLDEATDTQDILSKYIQ